MARLDGKVAIVTGGGHGIGRATCFRLAEEGSRVLVADRDQPAAHEVAELISGRGGTARDAVVDVSADDAVEAMVAAALEAFGRLDILVNVAGIDIVARLEDTETPRWNRTIDVNLTGIFRSCREAMPHLKASGNGAIVNIASVQGLRGFPAFPAYAASKAGIMGLTRQIAVDYGEAGVRVNCISPGAVDTNLARNSEVLEPELPPLADQAAPVDVPDPQPGPLPPGPRLFRSALPGDVANAVLFLVSDESCAITGQNLVVDGGTAIRGR